MTRPPIRRFPLWRAILVSVLAVGLVANLTLTAAQVELETVRAPFACLLSCGDQSLLDLVNNILLFVPIGWALSYWLRPGLSLTVCLLATITIEALQATIIPGRYPSLRDILANTAGGGIGIWLFRSWRLLLKPDPKRGMQLAAIASMAWAGILTISAAGTGLAPSNAPWYGFWTPDLVPYGRFAGQLLSVDLKGWSPANGPIPEPVPLRQAMREDSFMLTARVIWGAPPARLAPIFAVIDDSKREQVFIGQYRQVLWLRLRSRFDRWELRGQTLGLPRTPRWGPGDTVTIEAGLHHHRLVLRASGPGEVSEVELPQTVGLGWNSVAPFRLPLSDQWYLNSIWLAVLVGPVGYWFGQAAAGRGLLLAVAAAAGGLLLAPVAASADMTPAFEWAGTAVGTLLGWTLGWWVRRGSPTVRATEP